MTRPRWDRDWKNAALTALAYLALLAAAWCAWQAGRVIAMRVADAPASGGRPL